MSVSRLIRFVRNGSERRPPLDDTTFVFTGSPRRRGGATNAHEFIIPTS
jgi:hypothetical protein